MSSLRVCIAFKGPHGIGKTTLSSALCNILYHQYGVAVERVSFSTSLLRDFLADYNLSGDNAHEFLLQWERSREFKEENRHLVNKYAVGKESKFALNTMHHIVNSECSFFIVDDLSDERPIQEKTLKEFFKDALLIMDVDTFSKDMNGMLDGSMPPSIYEFIETYLNVFTTYEERAFCHPILDTHAWGFYSTQKSAQWMPEEIDYHQDIKDIERVSPEIMAYLEKVLMFFAVSDFYVNANIAKNLLSNKHLSMEANIYYTSQMAMENIHSEAYAKMVLIFIKMNDFDMHKRIVETSPSLLAKLNWIKRMSRFSKNNQIHLLMSAIMEGIFFSSAFAAINWLRSMNVFPGLTQANSLIARDENIHYRFAVERYKQNIPLRKHLVFELIYKAVIIEILFINEYIPEEGLYPVENSDGMFMTRDLMTQYVMFVAQRFIRDLGLHDESKNFFINNNHPFFIDHNNPFYFQDNAAIIPKNNFFERKGTEYRRAFVGEEDKSYDINNVYSL